MSGLTIGKASQPLEAALLQESVSEFGIRLVIRKVSRFLRGTNKLRGALKKEDTPVARCREIRHER